MRRPPPAAAQRTLLGDAARRFARNRLALVGLAMVALLLTLAVGADQIAPYAYDAADRDDVLRLAVQIALDAYAADTVSRSTDD